jgi:hypothetical protein
MTANNDVRIISPKNLFEKKNGNGLIKSLSFFVAEFSGVI